MKELVSHQSKKIKKQERLTYFCDGWFRIDLFKKMASENVPKTCKVITAETISKKLLTEVRETLATIQESGSGKPTLAAFLANGDPHAEKYAEWSKKTCEEK